MTPTPIGPEDTTPDLSGGFALMPTILTTTYKSGVPMAATLVEIQSAQIIPFLHATREHTAQYLSRDAAQAFWAMRRAAAGAGIALWIYSGFRSHEHQTRLYGEWQRGTRKNKPARPGWSLHESGNAADILRSHDDPDAGGPLVGPTDQWLWEHAMEYNYFRTVPSERWHWEHRR